MSTDICGIFKASPICLPRDKPSEDIFPHQWLRHAGEEIHDQVDPALIEAWF
jgi:hypothetical protein